MDVAPVVATMDIPQIMDLGLPSIGGDLPVDGSIGARTAAVSEPYEDGVGFGVLYEDPDALVGFFRDAHAASMQVAVHAIGDVAIDQALGAWERVYGGLDSRGRRHFRARRNRIEHFEMPSMAHVERAAVLGLGISVQPSFDLEWGHRGALYEQRLGAGRALAMNPFAELVSRGLVVGAGSDTPITELDPMIGLWALESHHDRSQRMTRDEAIRLWTIGSATLARLEDKKGRLEPGMQADFAAFDLDPFIVEDPRGVRPILTVSCGREVFSA